MVFVLRAHPVRGESHIQRNISGEVATHLLPASSRISGFFGTVLVIVGVALVRPLVVFSTVQLFVPVI